MLDKGSDIVYIVQVFAGKSHTREGSKVSTLSAPRHAFPVRGPYCLNMNYYYQSCYGLELARASAGIT